MNKPRGITLDFRNASRAVLVFFLAAAPTGVALAQTAAGPFPPTPWGLDTPAESCVVCHSLEAGGPFRVAPNLHGIVGAEKGRDRGWFGYSSALLTKGGTWTEEDLDLYLANANQFAPGTKKTIRVSDPEERKKIIDFLKTLSP